MYIKNLRKALDDLREERFNLHEKEILLEEKLAQKLRDNLIASGILSTLEYFTYNGRTIYISGDTHELNKYLPDRSCGLEVLDVTGEVNLCVNLDDSDYYLSGLPQDVVAFVKSMGLEVNVDNLHLKRNELRKELVAIEQLFDMFEDKNV